MNKVSEFSGTFYPDDEKKLASILESFVENKNISYKTKAVIVPHAGYIYSGHCAMSAFSHLELCENIFIIAPTHHYRFDNIAFPEYSYFETPLGKIEVNNKLISEISKDFPCYINNDLFNGEHSIEVQLPFIQYLNKGLFKKKIKIIPVLTGNCDYRLISELISRYWENSSFIISSDLSHYYTQEQSRQLDSYTAFLIETGCIEKFERQHACGITGIMGLVDFANTASGSLIRSEMYNSGDISNDKTKVVGYGSWFYYEGTTNNYIKSYCSEFIKNASKESIKHQLRGEYYIPENIPSVLTQLGATFVTLKENGVLRGCIGSIYPTRPIILDIIENAKNSAFNDSRFLPLTEEEFKNIDISISILSALEKIDFKDERDLLSKIYPYGIILAENMQRAVYLPVVWEQLPDREVFLNSLKEKAGWSSDYFSKKIEAYKFTTTCINE